MTYKTKLIGFFRAESAAFELDIEGGVLSQAWSVEDPGGAPTWTDTTDDFNIDPSPAGGGFFVLGAGGDSGDIAYFGMDVQFQKLTFYAADGEPGAGGTVAWQYWDGSTWSSLTVTDGTDGWKNGGDDEEVTWTAPGDWAATVVNGSASLYYVRAVIGTAYTTVPGYDHGSVTPDTITITLTDGKWWPSGDGSTAADDTGDLGAHIEALADAASDATAGLTVTLSQSTGIYTLALPEDVTGTLTWTAAGESLRDFLRFTGSTEALSSTPAAGDYAHKFGFYPYFTAVADLPIVDILGNQARADSGRTYTLIWASQKSHELEFVYEEGPYSSLGTEHQQLYELWVDHMAQGEEWRYYRDRATPTLTAYVRGTNPNGYHVFVMPITPWQPKPFQDGWYAWFTETIECWEYV